MALTITAAAEMVLDLIHPVITSQEAAQFRNRGIIRLSGFHCRVANVRGDCSFGVLVNVDWFRGRQATISKPALMRAYPQVGLDYQLLPTRSKLFALHYMDLYSYCSQLEQDRNMWFSRHTWGVLIDPVNEKFRWAGGNMKCFDLLRITCPEDFLRKAPHEEGRTASGP